MTRAQMNLTSYHVIDHDPRRHQPGPLFCPPCTGKHVIHQVTIDKTGQDPNADPVRQPDTRDNCQASLGFAHSVKISVQREKWKRKTASASYQQILGRVTVEMLIANAESLN